MTRNLVVSVFAMLTAFACSTSQEARSTDKGATLREGDVREAAGSVQALDAIQSSSGGSILVFGDAAASIEMLAAGLQGVNVTVAGALPNNLLAYNTIWHVGLSVKLTADEQARLGEFVRAGGGLHLTGETTEGDDMNESLGELINILVEGGGIQVGGMGSILGPGGRPTSPYLVNPDVLGGLSSNPNTVTNMRLLGVGGMDGISDTRNILLYGRGNVPVGAIWDSQDLVGGVGGLSIIMDSNWLQYLDQQDNQAFLENLMAFHLELSPNTPPEAVAEARVLGCAPVEGSVEVQMDGSKSSDPDGDPLTYTWLDENDVVLATGAQPIIQLGPGTHTITLEVSDSKATARAEIEVVVVACSVDCERPRSIWEYCTPECPCPHGVGDCDIDEDCMPGLRCLHDPGPDLNYYHPEVDVCSNDCPTAGMGAWNYCTEECPCGIGEGDCDSDSECEPGLVCVRDVGPAYGFDPEVDMCEPPQGL